MKLTLDEHLSPHFTVGEFFRSGTAIRLGIDNNPDAHPGEGISTAEVVENLRALCTEVLEPLRRRVGRVIVTSGYRCQELNKAATAMRYGHILERHSAVQQLLLEPMGIQQKRWIHVGFRRSE